MAERRPSLRKLAKLLPSGAAGLSMSLACADASATAVSEPPAQDAHSVKDRLQSIRHDVSSALQQYAKDGEPFVTVDTETRLAWWGNGGWGNGGWRNWGNGWHNGGWGNGWHNGWHNW